MNDDFEPRFVDALRSVDRPRSMSPEAHERARQRALDAYDRAAEIRIHGDSDGTVAPMELDQRDPLPQRPTTHSRALLAAAVLVVVAMIGGGWLLTRDSDDGAEVDVAERPLDPEFVLGRQSGDAVLAADVERWCASSIGDLRDAAAVWRAATSDRAAAEALLVALGEAASGYGDAVMTSESPIGAQRLNELADYGGRLARLRSEVTSSTSVPSSEVRALLEEFDAELHAIADGADDCEFLG